uniref:Chromatin accessibility complex protein 1 n=1 Tax=Capra hircus TaxID=9925 RepID=A0A8C2S2C5_CAPHI
KKVVYVGKDQLVSLPLSYIQVIMMSSPEVTSINQEVLVLTAKATELFGSPLVQYGTTYSFRHSSGKEKEALTSKESEAFQFIADILPKKILASTYLKMLKEKREEEEEEENDNNDESEVNEVEF